MKNSRRSFLSSLALFGLSASGAGSISFAAQNKLNHSKKANLPLFHEADICVLGGSATGVFAAVRAARLGAKVVIVEKQNCFGGVATSSMVNIWHSILDTEFKKQIIGGLTVEVMERLKKRNVVHVNEGSEGSHYTFNSQELKIELDEIILEHGIKPYLHTLFSEPFYDNGELAGVIVDGKSGRGLIKAKYFIDATGDGDLCHRMGIGSYTFDLLQPPTMCAHFEEFDEWELTKLLREHGAEFNVPDGFVWGADVIGTKTYMLAGTRVYNANCANVEDLTRAEMEGRRQVRAIMDLLRKYGSKNIGLNGLPSYIGVRETRHIKCLYQIKDTETMNGVRYDDAIANGSYRLDIHHQDKPGLTFRYLDGSEKYVRPGYPTVEGRWRAVTDNNPTFYQMPLRALIPMDTRNVMVAGRMLDSEIIAYSGIRVMVNMNQLGEAAGVASFLALQSGCSLKDVSYKTVRAELSKGGSVVI